MAEEPLIRFDPALSAEHRAAYRTSFTVAEEWLLGLGLVRNSDRLRGASLYLHHESGRMVALIEHRMPTGMGGHPLGYGFYVSLERALGTEPDEIGLAMQEHLHGAAPAAVAALRAFPLASAEGRSKPEGEAAASAAEAMITWWSTTAGPALRGVETRALARPGGLRETARELCAAIRAVKEAHASNPGALAWAVEVAAEAAAEVQIDLDRGWL